VDRERKDKGQGLVEYGLIIVLIALVVITALGLVAPQLNLIFSRVASHLS
jgi:pilus assembly protein Flp/PilA